MNRLKNHILILLLIPLLHSCNGQTNSNDKLKSNNAKEAVDTTLKLLTYGFPNIERQNSRNVIAKKWKIKFQSVAGCMVSDELVDSVKTVNERVNKHIEKKYGKNWNDKFEKEIDEEFEREKKITAILDRVDFIKKKDDQMDKEGNGLHYYMTPIENSTDYKVSVEGWGTIDKQDAWVSYYRMTVNYKTKKYKLLDDKIEKKE